MDSSVWTGGTDVPSSMQVVACPMNAATVGASK